EGQFGSRLTAGVGLFTGSALRSLVVIVAGMAVVLMHRSFWLGLGQLEMPALLKASGYLVFVTMLAMAVSSVAMGLCDFWMRYRRFEHMLRTTPDEQREEQKAIDGDPAIRSRRVQLARDWLRDPGELIAGTSLVLTGSAGLSVLLAGSPPPGRV